MRLLIIFLAIFAVCFGLFGCINAKSSTNREKKCECPCRTTETSIKTPNFFYVTSKTFSSIQHSTNEQIISNMEIENLPQSNFKNYDSVNTMTYDCANNNIYMLKYNTSNVTKKTLDVLYYDGNKLNRIKQVENMFDNAISIASDYSRNNIYWSENNNGNYSIKMTDKSFSKFDYIIYPNNNIPMSKIQVYPKRSEIFFLEDRNIWYTSILPNSTPNLLVATSQIVIDFAIDYATDNLCWLVHNLDPIYFSFYCVNIDTSPRPIVVPNRKFRRLEAKLGNLGAFNDTLYWTDTAGGVQRLYARTGYERVAELATLESNMHSFVSSNCPSNVAAASSTV